MYTAFVRSIIEYGNVIYMGAEHTHLSKLDRIQSTAQKLGKFEIESLGSRREAAAMALALKLLSGECRDQLSVHTPTLITVAERPNDSIADRVKRQGQPSMGQGIRVSVCTNTRSLKGFEKCFVGALPAIWDKIPQDVIERGQRKGWASITNFCKRALIGKIDLVERERKCQARVAIMVKKNNMERNAERRFQKFFTKRMHP